MWARPCCPTFCSSNYFSWTASVPTNLSFAAASGDFGPLLFPDLSQLSKDGEAFGMNFNAMFRSALRLGQWGMRSHFFLLLQVAVVFCDPFFLGSRSTDGIKSDRFYGFLEPESENRPKFTVGCLQSHDLSSEHFLTPTVILFFVFSVFVFIIHMAKHSICPWLIF